MFSSPMQLSIGVSYRWDQLPRSRAEVIVVLRAFILVFSLQSQALYQTLGITVRKMAGSTLHGTPLQSFTLTFTDVSCTRVRVLAPQVCGFSVSTTAMQQLLSCSHELSFLRMWEHGATFWKGEQAAQPARWQEKCRHSSPHFCTQQAPVVFICYLLKLQDLLDESFFLPCVWGASCFSMIPDRVSCENSES